MNNKPLQCHNVRPSTLPLLTGLSIGLIVGLGAGYLAWHRNVTEINPPTAPTGTSSADDFNNDEIVSSSDFISNPAKYKGRVLRFLMFPERGRISQGGSLKDFAGHKFNFYLSGQTGGVIAMDIPSDLQVPAVEGMDVVAIRFICAEGNLQQGNQVVSIKHITRNLP